MHLETAREVIHARRSTPVEMPYKAAPTGKFVCIEKKANIQDQRVPRPPPSKYNNFTDLTRLCEDVFLATEHTGMYKRPDSMRGDRSKWN